MAPGNQSDSGPGLCPHTALSGSTAASPSSHHPSVCRHRAADGPAPSCAAFLRTSSRSLVACVGRCMSLLVPIRRSLAAGSTVPLQSRRLIRALPSPAPPSSRAGASCLAQSAVAGCGHWDSGRKEGAGERGRGLTLGAPVGGWGRDLGRCHSGRKRRTGGCRGRHSVSPGEEFMNKASRGNLETQNKARAGARPSQALLTTRPMVGTVPGVVTR